MKQKKAFTLIELLIVVAIIAILAAIAVPNFLEAQTRARVSRVKSDMRSMATAIESYRVDHNAYPREYNSGVHGDPVIPPGTGTAGILFPGGVRNGIVQHGLSTPVAYITSVWIGDPFVAVSTDVTPFDEQQLTYQDMRRRTIQNTTSAFWGPAEQFYGQWRMASVGPDRRFAHGFTASAQLMYDPTNGTLSLGNIWRSQKLPDGGQPVVGVLIGAH